MTPEKINIAIAEHCGFTSIRMICGMIYGLRCGELMAIPNYHGDLNAMHEAIKSLDDILYPRYRWQLWRVAAPDETPFAEWRKYPKKGLPFTPMRGRKYNTSTAAHQAEAFVRAIGKYTEPTQP